MPSLLSLAGSLHAYRKALDIYRAEHQGHHNGQQALANGNHRHAAPLNPKLLNNAAVMHMRGGNYRVALELMEEAIQVSNAAALGILCCRHMTLFIAHEKPKVFIHMPPSITAASKSGVIDLGRPVQSSCEIFKGAINSRPNGNAQCVSLKVSLHYLISDICVPA